LWLRLTAGNRHDITQVVELVDGFAFEHLIANRGYAAQEIFDWVVEYGVKPVIPPHGRSKNKW